MSQEGYSASKEVERSKLYIKARTKIIFKNAQLLPGRSSSPIHPAGLFRDNFITPFGESHEYLGIAVFGIFICEIRLRNSPGPGTGTTGIDLNFVGEDFWKDIFQRRPADR